MEERPNNSENRTTQNPAVEESLNRKTKETEGSSEISRPKIGDSRPAPDSTEPQSSTRKKRKRRRGRSDSRSPRPDQAISLELDDEILKKRRGRERKGKAVGRYTMVVHVEGNVTQIAML